MINKLTSVRRVLVLNDFQKGNIYCKVTTTTPTCLRDSFNLYMYIHLQTLSFWLLNSCVSDAFLSRTIVGNMNSQQRLKHTPIMKCSFLNMQLLDLIRFHLYSYCGRVVHPIGARESLMSWSECSDSGTAWGWLEFLLHPERPEQAQSQFLGDQSRGFTQSINKADHWAAGAPRRQTPSASRKDQKKHLK